MFDSGIFSVFKMIFWLKSPFFTNGSLNPRVNPRQILQSIGPTLNMIFIMNIALDYHDRAIRPIRFMFFQELNFGRLV